MLAILLLGLFSTVFPPQGFYPGMSALPSVGPAAGLPVIGMDCGVGAREGVLNPASPPPVIGDGAVLDSRCNWSGDADALTAPDATTEPLVSDNPESASFVGPPGTGGGFSTEVRLFDLPPPSAGCPPLGTDTNCIDGFDIAVRFDASYLNAQVFDQRGLSFGDRQPQGSGGVLDLVRTIDNTNGVAHLAQVILGVTVPADANGGVTLFRIRFDVVGVGTSALHFPCNQATGELCEIAGPDFVTTTVQDGSFNSEPFFDVSANLNWNVSWSFSPYPMVPGSPVTFAARASCPGPACGGALGLTWDFNSDGTADATGASVTVTPPPPIVNRAKLTVSDGIGHTTTAVRRLPLAVNVQGPGTIAKGTTGSWTGRVLGGNPPYASGIWRFCPTITTAGVPQVCSNPSPTSTSTDLVDQVTTRSNSYNFAGVFNNTLKVTDTASREVSASSATRYFLATVTGSPPSYTVTVANVATATVGASVTVTITIVYFGDVALVYDGFKDGVYKPNPSLKDDSKIKFVDANNNNVRDSTEAVVYDANSNNSYDAGEPFITVTAPASGSSLKDDPKVRYYDANNDNAWNSGLNSQDVARETVLYDTNSNAVFDPNESAVGTGTGGTVDYFVVGSAPPAGASLKDDALVKYRDADVDNIRGISECTFYDVANNNVFDSATDPAISGTCPGSGTVKDDSRVKFVDTNNDNVFNVQTGYPFPARSPTFSVTFDFGDGFAVLVSGNLTISATHSYAVKGVYAIRVTAQEAGTVAPSRIQETGTSNIIVNPLAVSADFTVNSATPVTGLPATFTASASGGTSPYALSWNFGDGGTGQGSSVAHTYQTGGNKTVVLTATDANGVTATVTKVITVIVGVVPSHGGGVPRAR